MQLQNKNEIKSMVSSTSKTILDLERYMSREVLCKEVVQTYVWVLEKSINKLNQLLIDK